MYACFKRCSSHASNIDVLRLSTVKNIDCQLTNTTGGAETDDVKDNDGDWLLYKALDIQSVRFEI